MKVRAARSGPRVYLSLGGFFLDFGWFHSGNENPSYGITLTSQRIAVKGMFLSFCVGLKIKCGERELAVIGGWSDEDY